MSMSLDDFKQFVQDAESGTQYANWAHDNPGEVSRWQQYRDAILNGDDPTVPPTMTTPHGRELVDAGLIYLSTVTYVPASATPLWNGDLSTGNLSQWGGVEYVGVGKSNPPPLSNFVQVAKTIDGYYPPNGCEYMMGINCPPGDVYFSTTGWRTLLRVNDDGKGNPILIPQGHDSWWTFAMLVPSGSDDSNDWVRGFEVHQTKAPYVTVTGVAPAHLIARPGGAGISVDVAGGRDGARNVYVNGNYPPNYNLGKWQIFKVRYKHDLTPNGIFKLAWAEQHKGPLKTLVDVSGIGTQYEQTQNYFEWGLYRAQTGTTTMKMFLAGVQEHPTESSADSWVNTLVS